LLVDAMRSLIITFAAILSGCSSPYVIETAEAIGDEVCEGLCKSNCEYDYDCTRWLDRNMRDNYERCVYDCVAECPEEC